MGRIRWMFAFRNPAPQPMHSSAASVAVLDVELNIDDYGANFVWNRIIGITTEMSFT